MTNQNVILDDKGSTSKIVWHKSGFSYRRAFQGLRFTDVILMLLFVVAIIQWLGILGVEASSFFNSIVEISAILLLIVVIFFFLRQMDWFSFVAMELCAIGFGLLTLVTGVVEHTRLLALSGLATIMIAVSSLVRYKKAKIGSGFISIMVSCVFFVMGVWFMADVIYAFYKASLPLRTAWMMLWREILMVCKGEQFFSDKTSLTMVSAMLSLFTSAVIAISISKQRLYESINPFSLDELGLSQVGITYMLTMVVFMLYAVVANATRFALLILILMIPANFAILLYYHVFLTENEIEKSIGKRLNNIMLDGNKNAHAEFVEAYLKFVRNAYGNMQSNGLHTQLNAMEKTLQMLFGLCADSHTDSIFVPLTLGFCAVPPQWMISNGISSHDSRVIVKKLVRMINATCNESRTRSISKDQREFCLLMLIGLYQGISILPTCEATGILDQLAETISKYEASLFEDESPFDFFEWFYAFTVSSAEGTMRDGVKDYRRINKDELKKIKEMYGRAINLTGDEADANE